jgi:hypothetical protein
MSYLEPYMYMITDDNIISLIVKFAGNYCPHDITILDKKEYILDCIIGTRVDILVKLWKNNIVQRCISSLDGYFYLKAYFLLNIKKYYISKARFQKLKSSILYIKKRNWEARKAILIIYKAIEKYITTQKVKGLDIIKKGPNISRLVYTKRALIHIGTFLGKKRQ